MTETATKDFATRLYELLIALPTETLCVTVCVEFMAANDKRAREAAQYRREYSLHGLEE